MLTYLLVFWEQRILGLTSQWEEHGGGADWTHESGNTGSCSKYDHGKGRQGFGSWNLQGSAGSRLGEIANGTIIFSSETSGPGSSVSACGVS